MFRWVYDSLNDSDGARPATASGCCLGELYFSDVPVEVERATELSTERSVGTLASQHVYHSYRQHYDSTTRASAPFPYIPLVPTEVSGK